jgi:hypothetical protein
MYSQNKIFKNIYFSHLRPVYSVIAIMPRYSLRYKIMLCNSIEKLSNLNVIALDTLELLLCLKGIAL